MARLQPKTIIILSHVAQKGREAPYTLSLFPNHPPPLLPPKTDFYLNGYAATGPAFSIEKVCTVMISAHDSTHTHTRVKSNGKRVLGGVLVSHLTKIKNRNTSVMHWQNRGLHLPQNSTSSLLFLQP